MNLTDKRPLESIKFRRRQHQQKVPFFTYSQPQMYAAEVLVCQAISAVFQLWEMCIILNVKKKNIKINDDTWKGFCNLAMGLQFF